MIIAIVILGVLLFALIVHFCRTQRSENSLLILALIFVTFGGAIFCVDTDPDCARNWKLIIVIIESLWLTVLPCGLEENKDKRNLKGI